MEAGCIVPKWFLQRAAGLKKLKETEDQVANLQSGLAEKEKMLSVKNKEAEELLGLNAVEAGASGHSHLRMMSQMVKGQGEAEERKQASQKLQGELAEQSKVIEERRGGGRRGGTRNLAPTIHTNSAQIAKKSCECSQVYA